MADEDRATDGLPADDEPRVFHLITRLLHGGAEAKTIETATRLDGYEFVVGYGAEYSDVQITHLADHGIETVRFPLLRHYNPVTAVFAVCTIAWYLRRNEFDVVHTHSTEAGIVGRLAAALAGVPVVIHTVHGVPFTEDRDDLLNRFVLFCERCVAPLTDRIVTNADAIATEYLDRGIGRPDQYETVYSGISLDTYRKADPARDLPGDRPRVLMVGRIVEGKGFDVLLQAVEATESDEYSVSIVGDGDRLEWLESEIESRGLTDRVFTLGYREDVPELVAASDIFVLPSYREGTPRVISEAMAGGLPVIGTNIAGIPEQIDDGENGYLIPTGDPDALAARLDRLLADPDHRAAMAAASDEYVERFSRRRMVEALDEVYRSCLADRK